MNHSKNALNSFWCVLALVGVLAGAGALWPRTGFGQVTTPPGAIRLNCDEQPCDAVARGRAAFNDRNLNHLGGNGRSCADCHMPS